MSASEIRQNFFLRFIEESEITRKRRDFRGFWDMLFKLVAASYSLFLIYTAVSGMFPSSFIRGLFILFITVMIFLKYPGVPGSPSSPISFLEL